MDGVASRMRWVVPGRPRARTAAIALAVVALALLLAPRASLAQWDPGHVVHFDFARKRITEALPFDVPFYLLSPTPPGVTPATERRVFLVTGSRVDLDCEAIVRSSPDPAAFCSAFPSEQACKLPSAIVQAKPKDGSAAVQQIEITAPPLAPKKDYCFGIMFLRSPTPQEEAQLQAAAAATLRDFTSLFQQPVLTRQTLAALCADVRTAMERALGDDDLTLVPDEGSPLAQCGLPGALFSQGVLEAAGSNLETALDEAAEALTVVRASIATPAEALQKGIAGLGNAQEARGFLLGGSEQAEPLLLSPAQIDQLKDGVRKTWANVPTPTALGVVCPVAASTPAEHHLACFRATHVETLLDDLDSLRQSNLLRDRNDVVAILARLLADGHDVAATTWDGFQARAQWYVTADVGIAHAWKIDETFDYTGANVYLAPVNKKAPLQGFGLQQTWTRRLAFLVGLPNGTVEIPGTKPLFGDKPLVLGAGWRATDYIRFALGAVVFEEEEPDPLVDATRGEAVSPFASVSVDLDVVGIVKGLFNGNVPGGDS